MKGFHLSEREFETLLREGQHEVLYELPLALNIPSELKVAKQPDTEVTKALKRATRNRLQDAFLATWRMLGGEWDYWREEYIFHPDRKWRFDFANPASRIAVEINGGQWQKSGHSSGRGLQRDAEKLNAAQELGWNVWVFTTSMLSKRESPLYVGRLVRYIYEDRGRDGCKTGIYHV